MTTQPRLPLTRTHRTGMIKHLATLSLVTLLIGCGKPTPESPGGPPQPVGICPIHDLTFHQGAGMLPAKLTVSWSEEMHEAMQAYPYVRYNVDASQIVAYCPTCEAEVARITAPPTTQGE